MRRTVAVIAATLALNVGVFAGQNLVEVFAGQAVPSDLSKLTVNSGPLTIRFQNAQFADVVQLLGKAAGIEIRLAPDVSVTEPINLMFYNAKFENMFSALVRATQLSYTVVDEKTVLITAKKP